MDARRVGLAIRALRRRRRWRQRDLAYAAGVSQSAISLIERGHLDSVPRRRLARVAGALEGSIEYEVRWRGGALDRLLDEAHAALAAIVLAELKEHDWETQVEVSYSHYGERGSIDVLGGHPPTEALLVVEVKASLGSGEATLRKLDEKERLAPMVAAERFGWHASTVSKVLLFPEAVTIRRQLARHQAYLQAGLPAGGRGVRRWLRNPEGVLRGVWFLSNAASRKRGATSQRVIRVDA